MRSVFSGGGDRGADVSCWTHPIARSAKRENASYDFFMTPLRIEEHGPTLPGGKETVIPIVSGKRAGISPMGSPKTRPPGA
jgi:hypothetical protein